LQIPDVKLTGLDLTMTLTFKIGQPPLKVLYGPKVQRRQI